jgi:hypothetical protein
VLLAADNQLFSQLQPFKLMKTLPLFASSCALAALALTAHAQSAATPTKTADQRAASYKGPKVVKDSKTLGQKMVQKSKPTDMRMPIPVKVK